MIGTLVIIVPASVISADVIEPEPEIVPLNIRVKASLVRAVLISIVFYFRIDN